MYMEGDEHKEYRKIVLSCLSDRLVNISNLVEKIFLDMKPILLYAADEIDIISDFCHPLIIRVFSEIFGIKVTDYQNIVNISKPIAMFISCGDIGNENIRQDVVNSLNKTFDCIDHCILNANHGFIKSMINNRISVEDIKPLLINVIIDGFDPLLSVLSYYFYMLSNNLVPHNISNCDLFDEIVRIEPPFQYCARIAEEDMLIKNYKIYEKDRVTVFLSAVNRDPKIFEKGDEILHRDINSKHLSFGVGKHRCLGANLSKKICVILMNEMDKIKNDISLKMIRNEWINTIGFRALNKLTLKIERS